MPLDLSSLKKAVYSLERTVRVACSDTKMKSLDQDQQYAIRAGVIQNFEFTYELCWKFIQRWLKENLPQDSSDLPRTRKDFFRVAAQRKLIGDPLPWFEYGDARNLTSHTYSEDKAEIVFQAAVHFVPEAKSLLRELERNNG